MTSLALVTSRAGLALVAAVLALPATSAEAGFAPAIRVASGPLLNNSPQSVTVDGKGRSTVVWNQGDPSVAKARRVTAAGARGPILTLSPNGEAGFYPAVASTPAGRAFAAWREDSDSNKQTVKGRWIEPNGTLRPVRTLAAGSATFNAGDVVVTIAPSGVATVAYTNQNGGDLKLRRVSPASVVGAETDSVSGGFSQDPSIAALPNGDTLAVWDDAGPMSNVVSAAGVVGTPQPLSTDNFAETPRLAVDAHGNGLAAWRSENSADDAVGARRFDSSGAPVGTELTVDPVTQDAFVGSQIGVAANSNGRFLVTWTRQKDGVKNIVHGRIVRADGTFGGVQHQLSPDSQNAASPKPALLDRGVGAVGWYHNENSEVYDSLGRAVKGANATPLTNKPVKLVAGAQDLLAASNPARGVGAFLSDKSAAASAQLFLSRFLVVPICSPSQAKTTKNKAVRAKLDCKGPGIERAKVVIKPKHGTAGAFDPVKRTLRYVPDKGFVGKDSFEYRAANDGGRSKATKVSITVSKPK